MYPDYGLMKNFDLFLIFEKPAGFGYSVICIFSHTKFLFYQLSWLVIFSIIFIFIFSHFCYFRVWNEKY